MIVSERKVHAAVLEADISEAGEHLSAAKVGLSNEHDSSSIVIGESEVPDVSGGSYGVVFCHCSLNTCSVSPFLLFCNQAP